MSITKFSVGDRVRHVGMNEIGTVTRIGRDGVFVTFDRIGIRGKPWHGLYDDDWFRTHDNWLLPEDQS